MFKSQTQKNYEKAVKEFEDKRRIYIKTQWNYSVQITGKSEQERDALIKTVDDARVAIVNPWRELSRCWLAYQLELQKRIWKVTYYREGAQFHHRELFYDIEVAHNGIDHIVSDISRAGFYQNELSGIMSQLVAWLTVAITVLTFVLLFKG